MQEHEDILEVFWRGAAHRTKNSITCYLKRENGNESESVKAKSNRRPDGFRSVRFDR